MGLNPPSGFMTGTVAGVAATITTVRAFSEPCFENALAGGQTASAQFLSMGLVMRMRTIKRAAERAEQEERALAEQAQQLLGSSIQLQRAGGHYKARYEGRKTYVFGATPEQATKRLLCWDGVPA